MCKTEHEELNRIRQKDGVFLFPIYLPALCLGQLVRDRIKAREQAKQDKCLRANTPKYFLHSTP
jgi:hypothetical protein